VTRSKMGTRHTLLAVLCYSVPLVDASQQIATFGACTFDLDDAGGSFSGSQAKKEVKIYRNIYAYKLYIFICAYRV